jgi:hypothetical protein
MRERGITRRYESHKRRGRLRDCLAVHLFESQALTKICDDAWCALPTSRKVREKWGTQRLFVGSRTSAGYFKDIDSGAPRKASYTQQQTVKEFTANRCPILLAGNS